MPDVIEEIDCIFRYIKSPPSGFQNDPNSPCMIKSIVDALSLYIKRIFGIDESESFNYQIVNKYFPKDLKIYLKKAACYP